MATVGVTPIQMKDATLTIAGDDYTAAVSSVTLTPTPTWRTGVDMLGRQRRAVLVSVAWSCRVGLLQDVESGSLLRYLALHAGEMVGVVFTPKAGGAAYSATVVLAPSDVGGAAADLLESSVDLPVIGSPAVA